MCGMGTVLTLKFILSAENKMDCMTDLVYLAMWLSHIYTYINIYIVRVLEDIKFIGGQPRHKITTDSTIHRYRMSS